MPVTFSETDPGTMPRRRRDQMVASLLGDKNVHLGGGACARKQLRWSIGECRMDVKLI